MVHTHINPQRGGEEQGQPKETSGETSRKTLKPDNRQREQATRSQSKGREGRGSNSGMQKSNSAEENQPKGREQRDS